MRTTHVFSNRFFFLSRIVQGFDEEISPPLIESVRLEIWREVLDCMMAMLVHPNRKPTQPPEIEKAVTRAAVNHLAEYFAEFLETTEDVRKRHLEKALQEYDYETVDLIRHHCILEARWKKWKFASKLGQLRLSLMVEHKKDTLCCVIHVQKGMGFSSLRETSPSCFVKAKILTQFPNPSASTVVQKDTHEPVFDSEIRLPFTFSVGHPHVLWLGVFNWKRFGRPVAVGEILVDIPFIREHAVGWKLSLVVGCCFFLFYRCLSGVIFLCCCALLFVTVL
eukprot:m.210202 g.210202  ORF g.210202 m.210202 type:complete len:279 (+) comp26121_c0_seq1:193-1029(+)